MTARDGAGAATFLTGASAALVKTVISIARTMALPGIADGVETTPQRDFLQANGCSQMQGYALGAPVAVDALAGLFAAA